MIRRVLIAALVAAAAIMSVAVDDPVSAEREASEAVTGVLQSRGVP